MIGGGGSGTSYYLVVGEEITWGRSPHDWALYSTGVACERSGGTNGFPGPITVTDLAGLV